MDCRKVDPKMTAGGLTAKQMREIRSLNLASERAAKAMLMRAAGYASYEQNLARSRERDRAARQRRRERRQDSAA